MALLLPRTAYGDVPLVRTLTSLSQGLLRKVRCMWHSGSNITTPVANT